MRKADDILFTAAERALLRFEFPVRFGQAPRLADSMWLRTWRGGPQAGQPKAALVMRSMLNRGLVTIELVRPGALAYFTAAGYAALRLLAQDRRALNPAQYGHLLEELGLKPVAMATLDDAAAGMQLHTTGGERKYLTADERDRFLRVAEAADRDVRAFCMTLALAGCRLSEALALTADRVDLAAGVLVLGFWWQRTRTCMSARGGARFADGRLMHAFLQEKAAKSACVRPSTAGRHQR